jgi:hypothetical protein
VPLEVLCTASANIITRVLYQVEKELQTYNEQVVNGDWIYPRRKD